MSTTRFADIEILRYDIPGFDALPLLHKKYLYYLSQAALCGRDILYAQHHRDALPLRYLLEELLPIARVESDRQEYEGFRTYLYRVWFSSGLHHHYAETKFVPSFSESYFRALYAELSDSVRQRLEDADFGIERAVALIFDKAVDPIRRASGDDDTIIERSSVNFYDKGISSEEARDFYASIHEVIEPGLNSRLIRHPDGTLDEMVASTKGLYAPAISQIVYNLRQATEVAPSPEAASLLELLIAYYESGELGDFYRFSIDWVRHHDPSGIDFINGFIETYTDPLGLKGSWEAIVQLIDREGSFRTQMIAEKASDFESRSPIDQEYKKGEITGVSAAAIHVVMLGGDSYPASPLGINLPNDERIRAEYGSKSVTLTNISQAVDDANADSGLIDAFYYGEEVKSRLKKYGHLTGMLHTDLHECLGHGSGRLMPDVSGSALGAYDSTIEEARADLNGLYFIADPAMVSLGLLPNSEAYKAEYDHFFTNALITQLARLEEGQLITESHMQDRALIARAILDMPSADEVIRLTSRGDKHYVEIADYGALRGYIGDLLKEVQRIKSCGDIEAAKRMVAQYGRPVDDDLRAEAVRRYQDLGLAPYRGFLNPRMSPIQDDRGEMIDVVLDYSESYEEQMLRYSREYGFLPLRERPMVTPDGRWLDTLNRVRRQLRRQMDGIVSASMRAKGVDYRINFGVTLPRLKELAMGLPHDMGLARLMWSKEVREMKILATMIAPVEALTYDDALKMCHESPYVEVSEQLCINLLLKAPWVERLTLDLWAEDRAYDDQTAVIPYILMTRMLMMQTLGYELRQPLLTYAARDLSKSPSSLTFYLYNALSRLIDSSDEGHHMVSSFIATHPGLYDSETSAHAILKNLEELL